MNKKEAFDIKKSLDVLNRVKHGMNPLKLLVIGDREEMTVFLLHILPMNEPTPTLSSFKILVLQHKIVFLGFEHGIQFTLIPKMELLKECFDEYDFTIMCFNFTVDGSFEKFEKWNNVVKKKTNFSRILIGCGSEKYEKNIRQKIFKDCSKSENLEYWPFPSTYVNIVPVMIQKCFIKILSEKDEWRDFPKIDAIFPHLWVFEETLSSIHDVTANLVREIAVYGHENIISTWGEAMLKKLRNLNLKEKKVEFGVNTFRLFCTSCSWIHGYRKRVKSSETMMNEILQEIFGKMIDVYFYHIKPSQDLMYLFDEYIFWIPYSEESFSMILCELWMNFIVNSRKKKKTTKKKTSFTNSLDQMSDEVFEMLIKSFFKEQQLRLSGQECGDEEEARNRLNEMLKLLVDDLFIEYRRDLNLRLPKFLCQMFELEGTLSIIGFDIVLHYYSRISEPKHFLSLLEFLRVIVHHPYFIKYSREKRHCLSEILMEMTLKNVINMNKEIIEKNTELYTYDGFIKPFLELFYDHLYLGMLDVGIDPLKKQESKMRISLCYFPFVKKISLVKEMKLQLKKVERIKLSCIILYILQNLNSKILLDWFRSSSESVAGLSYWFEYMLESFIKSYTKEESYCQYCKTLLDLFLLFVSNVVIGENKEIFKSVLELSFRLLEILKPQKEIYDYFVASESEKLPSIFRRVVLGLRRVSMDEKIGRGWRDVILFVLNKYNAEIAIFGKEEARKSLRLLRFNSSVFDNINEEKFFLEEEIEEEGETAIKEPIFKESSSKSLSLVMIECLSDLLNSYMKNISTDKIRCFVYQKEEIGKNLLLNETLTHTLKAASICKLMEYIIKSRSSMTEVFLTTHQLFTSTLDLLNMFLTYYEYLKKGGKKEVNEVIYLLKLWIRKYFYQFKNEEISYLLFVIYFLKRKRNPFLLEERHIILLRKTLLECLSRENQEYLPREIEEWGDWNDEKYKEDSEEYFVSSTINSEMSKGLRPRRDSNSSNSSTSSSSSTTISSNSSSSSSRKGIEGDGTGKEWYEDSCNTLIPKNLKGKLGKWMKKVMKMKKWKELTNFIMKWDSFEIAKQLTLIDFRFFKNISSMELVFRLHPQLGSAPNLTSFESRSKKICSWMQNCIIDQKSSKKRVEFAQKFISTMDHLYRLKNYFGMDYCVSALEATPIERLISPKNQKIESSSKSSKQNKIYDEDYGLIEKYSKLIQGNDGSLLIKELENQIVAIPVWKVFHIKLIKIEKLNPERYEREFDKKKVQLININKQRQIYNILTQTKNFQKQNMFDQKISRVDCLYFALMRLSEFEYLTKSEVFDKSMEYKPKKTNLNFKRLSQRFFSVRMDKKKEKKEKSRNTVY